MAEKTFNQIASILTVLVCLQGVSPVEAQDELQGPSEVFKFLAESLEKVGAPDKQGNADQQKSAKEQIQLLQKRWDSYFDERANLSPEASNKDWLGIFDLYTETSLNAKRMDWSVWKREPGKVYSLLGDLPDTAVWDQWLNSLQNRKGEIPTVEKYTSFLVEFLKGNKDTAWKRWEEFSKALRDKEFAEDDYQSRQLIASLDPFEEAIADALKMDSYKLSKFERNLKKREGSEGEDSERNPFGMGPSLQVPQLAKLTSVDHATALLKRVFALKFAPHELNMSFDEKTAEIALSILVASPELIQRPHWDLITNADAVPLYEIYATRFPDAVNTARRENDYSWQSALEWVITAHLLKGDVKEAITVATANAKKDSTETGVPGNIVDLLLSKRKGGALFSYYEELLDKSPSVDVWASMINLGARINRSGEVRELAEATVAKQQQASSTAKYSALDLLVNAALADDEVTKGIGFLRKKILLTESEIEKLLDQPKPKQNRKWKSEFQDWGGKLAESAQRIESIGRVTKQEEIRKEGTAILNKWYEKRIANYGENDYGFGEIIEHYIENDEFALAEKTILDRVKTETGKALEKLKKENYPGSSPFNSSILSESPELLIKIYAKLNRHQDVLEIFKKWPFWGAFDVSSLSSGSGNLAFELAKALEQTGDKKTATKILKSLFFKGILTDNDKAYAMLLRLEGQNALTTLDALYARDAFEERPLIWKGKLLLESKKFDAAETVIRKAISIDPSDGEQGKGDRMRVYEVLADILTAKNNKEDAKLYREVLQAIRIAEDADDVYAAGLTSRGIKQYNEALTHFADAYCIQSRLAKQLNNAGRINEARVHYRRSFELMPDSFGRMESHCFGCEGVFNGSNAQAIAEQVFTNLIKEQPMKPQVYYLFGYLRASQDRDKEALELYQKAVELDPDYINAWKKVSGYGQSPLLTLKLRDQASIALARLDPYDRHGGSSGGNVFDIKGMLTQLESVDSIADNGDETLFALTATRKFTEKLVDIQIAEAGDAFANQGMSRDETIKRMTFRSNRSSKQGPRTQIRDFLSQHQVLHSWHQYYQNILQLAQ